MKNDEIPHETLFKLLFQFLRITKKFNELEKISIDLENNEKLYPSEFHIIEALGNNRANNVTQLSYNFQITKGAVSQVANKLYYKGFINKERNKNFGKEIILSLTPKGINAFGILNKRHEKMAKEFTTYLESFKSEEIDSFVQILCKIEEYIDIFLKDKI